MSLIDVTKRGDFGQHARGKGFALLSFGGASSRP